MALKLVLPKGRISNKVIQLLNEMGITLVGDERNYRPAASGFDLEVKLLKSQNIPSLVELGQHDIGFAGQDWIYERRCEVEVIKELGFDPVRIVACIPEDWDFAEVKQRKVIVASEYKQIATDYLERNGFDYQLLRSYGATEVFPPEDADMIIDNTSTGTTIRANRLKIVDEVMRSATQFIANKQVLRDPGKRREIDDLLTVMQAVLNGRERVLLEMNCNDQSIEKIVQLLPAMRSPTVSRLYNEEGFAIKAAVPKKDIQSLLPALIAAGATDILETPINKSI
ncbi:MAG: ATP phosphoribosyltransferase [Gammaproteobacteria bacterium]|nr:ATP phosphoribosyltransferase [Gammaproteobacteria bacterium]NVK89556.1 ATP phosphoribosyltransferase [Gammaproteobacteria bacterium]